MAIFGLAGLVAIAGLVALSIGLTQSGAPESPGAVLHSAAKATLDARSFTLSSGGGPTTIYQAPDRTRVNHAYFGNPVIVIGNRVWYPESFIGSTVQKWNQVPLNSVTDALYGPAGPKTILTRMLSLTDVHSIGGKFYTVKSYSTAAYFHRPASGRTRVRYTIHIANGFVQSEEVEILAPLPSFLRPTPRVRSGEPLATFSNVNTSPAVVAPAGDTVTTELPCDSTAPLDQCN